MKRMFGTAGIRGVTNVEITARLALEIGLAYGDFLCESREKKCEVGIGHDTRYGAEVLARAAAAGLAAAGCDVHFYGCVGTGVFSINVRECNHDGGLLITGSHMPPDRIGLIAVLGDGACAPHTVTDEIEKRYRAREKRTRRVAAEDIGRIIEAFHPYELYISKMVTQIDARLVKAKKFRIVVDPANGAASYIAKEFFEWLGCEVEMMNFDPSPIPARPSEPRAGTVTGAIQRVMDVEADLGVCFDIDADRSLFITSEGKPVSEDTIGAIFAREELEEGDLCVVPINSSGLIEQVCREKGARLEYCAVGQPVTLEAIKAKGAVYSYEESGKYWFARKQLWADGLYSGARLLEVLAGRHTTLTQLVAEFPSYHQVKHSVKVEDARKADLMRAVEEMLGERLLEDRVRDVTIDGFKRCYKDDSWLMIRASGTEPLIRVYSDAPSPERANELVRQGKEVLEEAALKTR